MTTTASTNSDRSVHRTAVIGAAPAAIFAVLTDPRTHVALDGSGTVQGVVDAPERLELGSHFRMQM